MTLDMNQHNGSKAEVSLPGAELPHHKIDHLIPTLLAGRPKCSIMSVARLSYTLCSLYNQRGWPISWGLEPTGHPWYDFYVESVAALKRSFCA
jgi:hypothetical protein